MMPRSSIIVKVLVITMSLAGQTVSFADFKASKGITAWDTHDEARAKSIARGKPVA